MHEIDRQVPSDCFLTTSRFNEALTFNRH